MLPRLCDNYVLTDMCFNVIIITVFLTSSAAAILRACHENPCKNSGECFRVSDNTEHSFCQQGFTEFGGACYQLRFDQVSWIDARGRCKGLYGANLVSIDSLEEHEFLKRFVFQQMAGNFSAANDGAFLYPHVWTSGKFDIDDNMKTTGRFWWMKTDGGNDPVGLGVWEMGKVPNYVGPDGCIVLSSTSNYQMWAVDKCTSDANFYLCEYTEVSPNIRDGYYFYQCRCPQGFSGLHCEQLSPSNEHSAQLTICDDQPLEFSCQIVEDSINIDYAFYGQPLVSPPASCHQGLNADSLCVASNTLSWLMKRYGILICPVLQTAWRHAISYIII